MRGLGTCFKGTERKKKEFPLVFGTHPYAPSSPCRRRAFRSQITRVARHANDAMELDVVITWSARNCSDTKLAPFATARRRFACNSSHSPMETLAQRVPSCRTLHAGIGSVAVVSSTRGRGFSMRPALRRRRSYKRRVLTRTHPRRTTPDRGAP